MSGCCPPPPRRVCPQTSPAPSVPAKCLSKPIMRGLHWAQTQRIMATTFILCAIGGSLVYNLVGKPRRAAYKEYYAHAHMEEWADEMAKKGLFQAVPKGSGDD